jgi:flagellar motor switch protein FliN/FliY
MNNEQLQETVQSFLAALAPALGDVFSQFTGAEWKLTPSPRPAEEPPAAEPEQEQAAPPVPVYYKLDFTGSVEGGAMLQFARELAAGIAAQILGEPVETALQDFNDERSEALLEAVRAALKQCAGTLGSAPGTASVQVGISQESLEPAASGGLDVLEGGGAKPSITVLFTSAFLESLAKPSAPVDASQATPPAEQKESSPAAASTKPPTPTGKSFDEAQLGLILDVELSVTLRFGQRQLSLREILDLASGAVIELDRQVDEPVELLLDGRVIARGEAVIVDGNYGLRVTEIPQALKPAMVS